MKSLNAIDDFNKILRFIEITKKKKKCQNQNITSKHEKRLNIFSCIPEKKRKMFCLQHIS